MRKTNLFKIIFFLILIDVLSNVCFADDVTDLRGDGGIILQIPVGTRPAGLGYAFTAIADDINAPFFNPAGLAQIRDTKLGVNYNFLSFKREQYQTTLLFGGLHNAGFALYMNKSGVSDIPEIDVHGIILGSFKSSQMVVGLSCGGSTFPWLSLGGGMKVLIHNIYDKQGIYYGFDIGTLCKTGKINNLIEHISVGQA